MRGIQLCNAISVILWRNVNLFVSKTSKLIIKKLFSPVKYFYLLNLYTKPWPCLGEFIIQIRFTKELINSNLIIRCESRQKFVHHSLNWFYRWGFGLRKKKKMRTTSLKNSQQFCGRCPFSDYFDSLYNTFTKHFFLLTSCHLYYAIRKLNLRKHFHQ